MWDPFCGSGLELVERGLLAPVRSLYGTDTNGNAIMTAQRNLRAANVQAGKTELICCDFARLAERTELPRNGLSLIITNPPLGKRVPIAELRSLVQELFALADRMLEPGGRFVLVNPAPDVRVPVGLQRVYRQVVDLGGFTAVLEKYVKSIKQVPKSSRR